MIGSPAVFVLLLSRPGSGVARRAFPGLEMNLFSLQNASIARAATLSVLGIALAAAAAGCQQVPTHQDIMYYNRQYELIAAREVAELRGRLDAGEITEPTFEAEARRINEAIPEKAMEALYRDHLIRTRPAQARPAR